ncbi:MAG: hypothetical protein QHH06_15230 [Clostridiales bacterium]|jgi:capsular polysaccharide biosynthesis protein|nr:hypothetical protein [Eubacteriales bacterium]MDH7567787.1 hypothetical protein [Clostridiales bacterium]
MEEFDLKLYLKVLLKNWKWIVFFISLTLVVSIAYNYALKKPPVLLYQTESSVDATKAVLLDKTFPSVVLTKEVKQELIDKALSDLKLDGRDFDIKFDESKANTLKIEIVSSKEEMLPLLTNTLLDNVVAQIKNKYYVNQEDVLGQLDGEYKKKIMDPKGNLDMNMLKALYQDKKKADETKSPELKSAEKMISDLDAQIEATKAAGAQIEEDEARIEGNLELYKTGIASNESNISETDIRLKELKSRQKEMSSSSPEITGYIQKQILYLEQNRAIYVYYKDYYTEAVRQAENQLTQTQGLKLQNENQLALQNAQLESNKALLKRLTDYHNKQVENYKKLYTVAYNNNILKTAILKKATGVNKVPFVDTRPRQVIVSAWLAFILACCFAILKEYPLISGKRLIKTKNQDLQP